MTDIHDEIEIQATPEQVWQVLGDLAAAPRYVPGISSATMAGTTRICVMADGQEIHEAISDFSPTTRSYRYEHIKTPMPVESSGGAFAVTAHGNNALVRVEAQLRAKVPDMQAKLADMMRGGLRQTLENLKACVERAAA